VVPKFVSGNHGDSQSDGKTLCLNRSGGSGAPGLPCIVSTSVHPDCFVLWRNLYLISISYGGDTVKAKLLDQVRQAVVSAFM
jgi:hypothetical protein